MGEDHVTDVRPAEAGRLEGGRDLVSLPATPVSTTAASPAWART
jgi:hypothetical protein